MAVIYCMSGYGVATRWIRFFPWLDVHCRARRIAKLLKAGRPVPKRMFP